MTEINDAAPPRRYTLAINSAVATVNQEKERLMKLTDALRGEHAVIYELFDHVRETVAKSDELEVVRAAASVLERLIESHARIEDDLLFPRLEPFIGEMGPLAVMRSEHSGIRDFLEAARRETEIGALKSVLGGLLDLAHGHFQKEEMALFAMAEQFLDDAALTELGDQWAARRKVSVDSQGCTGAA